MKKLLLFFLIILSTQFLFSQVRVRGYTKKNGTTVEPHMRSSPNSNPYDNYSFPGNTNPYTGKTSTGNPDTYLNNYYNKRSNNIDYSNTGLLKDVNPYMGTTNYTPPNTEYNSNTIIYNNDINNNNYNYDNISTPTKKKTQPTYQSSLNEIYNTDTYKYYNNKTNEDNLKIYKLEEDKRKVKEENLINDKINQFKLISKKKKN